MMACHGGALFHAALFLPYCHIFHAFTHDFERTAIHTYAWPLTAIFHAGRASHLRVRRAIRWLCRAMLAAFLSAAMMLMR